MRILQFAFDGGPENPYLPHNHEVNSVVYTGTHDNDTTLAGSSACRLNSSVWCWITLVSLARPCPGR